MAIFFLANSKPFKPRCSNGPKTSSAYRNGWLGTLVHVVYLPIVGFRVGIGIPAACQSMWYFFFAFRTLQALEKSSKNAMGTTTSAGFFSLPDEPSVRTIRSAPSVAVVVSVQATGESSRPASALSS